MARQHVAFLQSAKRHLLRHMHALLFLPIVCAPWVSSYNAVEPSFIGVPFFYWYQLLWIALSAILNGIVYLLEQSRSPAGSSSQDHLSSEASP